jgi:hypothetical protein
MIDQNKDNLRSGQVLTMNALYEEACRIEKRMICDTSLSKGEKCEELRVRVEYLYGEMLKAEPSQMTQELQKIINH